MTPAVAMARADSRTGSAPPQRRRVTGDGDADAGTLRPTHTARMSETAADVAAVGWASFLAACLGTFIAFAFIDPSRLGDASDVIDQIGPMTGYGIGFLLFWLVGAAAGGMTWLLIRTSRRSRRQRAREAGTYRNGESPDNSTAREP